MTREWQIPLDLGGPVRRLTLRRQLLRRPFGCGSVTLTACVREACLDLEARCEHCREHGGTTWSPAVQVDDDQTHAETAPYSRLNATPLSWIDALPPHMSERLGAGADREADAIEDVTRFIEEALALTCAMTHESSAHVAMVHHPSAGLQVYRAVRCDLSGRVEQLSHHEPLLLALWVRAGFPTEPIVQGRPQRVLIRALADHHGVDPSRQKSFAWWIRRLPPWADPRDVPRVAAIDIPPSDMPGEPDDCLRWFRAIMGVVRAFGVDAPEPLRTAAARYVSRHWEEAPMGRPVFARDLTRYLRGTSREISRRTDPRMLFIDVTMWCADADAVRAARSYVEELERIGDDALPPAPWPDTAREGVSIRAIRTARELFEEGQEMEHCAGIHVWSAWLGRIAVYSVDVQGVRSTLCFERTTRLGVPGWRRSEHRGRQNVEPGAESRRAVVNWLRRERRRARGGG